MMTSLWGHGHPGDVDVFVQRDHRYAMWDAAYLLGALSPIDRREFEAHLASCPQCLHAVAELSGMPALLSLLNGNDVAAITGFGHAAEVPAMPSELLPPLLAT